MLDDKLVMCTLCENRTQKEKINLCKNCNDKNSFLFFKEKKHEKTIEGYFFDKLFGDDGVQDALRKVGVGPQEKE